MRRCLALLHLVTDWRAASLPRLSALAAPALWDGDRQFLPLVFDRDPRAFHGVMPYRDGRMVSWDYSRI